MDIFEASQKPHYWDTIFGVYPKVGHPWNQYWDKENAINLMKIKFYNQLVFGKY